MTKQEEIREWWARSLYRRASLPEVNIKWEELTSFAKECWFHLADDDLSYLRDNGVVIKVKCPDCVWGQFKEESVGMTPCFHCNSTGYIIEPLIKDDK